MPHTLRNCILTPHTHPPRLTRWPRDQLSEEGLREAGLGDRRGKGDRESGGHIIPSGG